MTNKTTKSSLLLSSLALLLCFTMLLGTTFAWFTDSATSANNIIKAGNLDIDVQYTLDGENWDALDGADDLFQKGLWEPGHTEVVALKIENKGSLALKYAANMNIVSETVGKTKDNKDIVLSDILTVDSIIMDTGAWGDALVKVAFQDESTLQYSNTALFKDANVLGSDEMLQSGTSKYLIVKVDMAETVSNEANAKDKDSVPSITFGINVLATQLTYENDSFGNQYDKDALYPVIDAEGLAGALEEGKDVKLEADITLDETIAVTGDIAVDLNGFDLDASTNDSRPFEMADGATLTINGGDEEVTCGAYGLVNIPAGNDATVVINGGKYTAETNAGSFIKPRGDGEIKIVLNNVEYTDNSADGYALDCTGYSGENLSVEINGGKFESTIGMLLSEGAKVNGAEIVANNTKNMQPAIYATGDMTIKDCIIKAEKSHAVAVAGGATLNVINCDVSAGSDADALAFQVFSSGGTINVTGGSYDGKYGTTGPIKAGCPDAVIIIDGNEVYRKTAK